MVRTVSFLLTLPLAFAGCNDPRRELEIQMAEGVSLNVGSTDISWNTLLGSTTSFDTSRTDGLCSAFKVCTTDAWLPTGHYDLVPDLATCGVGEMTASLSYSEGCASQPLKRWVSKAGSFIVAELVGAHADVQFDFVSMEADTSTAALGTFNVTGRGYTDTLVLPRSP